MGKLDYVLIFLLGFFSCALIFVAYFGFVGLTGLVIVDDNLEMSFPSDWVSGEDILVFDDEVVIKVDGATISEYGPTGSMKPVLGVGTSGIRIVPESEGQINIGDIVSFRKEGVLIVHRVIEKGFDDVGVYFVTKGDNFEFADEKIRFEDIEYVLIGILY